MYKAYPQPPRSHLTAHLAELPFNNALSRSLTLQVTVTLRVFLAVRLTFLTPLIFIAASRMVFSAQLLKRSTACSLISLPSFLAPSSLGYVSSLVHLLHVERQAGLPGEEDTRKIWRSYLSCS